MPWVRSSSVDSARVSASRAAAWALRRAGASISPGVPRRQGLGEMQEERASRRGGVDAVDRLRGRFDRGPCVRCTRGDAGSREVRAGARAEDGVAVGRAILRCVEPRQRGEIGGARGGPRRRAGGAVAQGRVERMTVAHVDVDRREQGVRSRLRRLAARRLEQAPAPPPGTRASSRGDPAPRARPRAGRGRSMPRPFAAPLRAEPGPRRGRPSPEHVPTRRWPRRSAPPPPFDPRRRSARRGPRGSPRSR